MARPVPTIAAVFAPSPKAILRSTSATAPIPIAIASVPVADESVPVELAWKYFVPLL
ncbi:hypothetical protein D3C80_2185230 [compost metagenome]